MERIYWDYAASTPVHPDVLRVMRDYYADVFGNAGSLHSFGQDAIALLDRSREIVADSIRAGFREVVFIGSATEANNLALRGMVKAWMRMQRNKELGMRNKAKEKKTRARVIVSSIEHDSILETCRELERNGVEVVTVPVNSIGVVDLKRLEQTLNKNTIFVSVMYGNNEVGTVQPIREVRSVIQRFRDSITTKKFLTTIYPLFHTDAVQTFQYLPCIVDELGVDFMTISGHKICGPKGVGVLYVRNKELGIRNKAGGNKDWILPVITGGGQEFGLRAGTENVPLIAGFAKAIQIMLRVRDKEKGRVARLKLEFWKGLKKIFPEAEVNGEELGMRNKELGGGGVLPHILSVYFPGVSAEHLLMQLDIQGIAVSSGAACSSRSFKPSHVLVAMGHSTLRAQQSVRFSFGRFTTLQEVREALKRMKGLQV